MSSIDKQIQHLIHDKGISLEGEKRRTELRLMGYYHGYKGYRFCRRAENQLQYSDFSELKAVYDFDMGLKELIYPKIMFLETALKNFTLEEVIERVPDGSFSKVYGTLMTEYKRYTRGSDELKKAQQRRLEVRKKFSGLIKHDYRSKPVVRHFYDSGRNMPIWAVFELLTLGEFAMFLESLGDGVLFAASRSVGIAREFDNDGRLLVAFVDAIKELRNSVAHNDAVFDARFREEKLPERLSLCLEKVIGVRNVSFSSITDYLLLIAYLSDCLGMEKNELATFVIRAESLYSELRRKVPLEIFVKILGDDSKKKLSSMKEYIYRQ